jgi:hypothetical protein
MMPAAGLPRDEEECRLSDPAYMKLHGDLRAIRLECNEDMLAIIAHCKKKQKSLTVH